MRKKQTRRYTQTLTTIGSKSIAKTSRMLRRSFKSFEWSRSIEEVARSKLFWNQYLPREKDCRWNTRIWKKKKLNTIATIEIECCSSWRESESDVLREVIATPKPQFSIQDDIEMHSALEYVFLTSLLMVLKTHRMGAAAEEPEFQNKGTSRDYLLEFIYSTRRIFTKFFCR